MLIRLRRSTLEWGVHALLIAGGILVLIPFYWMIISSLKDAGSIFASKLELWPESVTLQNYVHLLVDKPFGRWMLNSLIVAIGSTVIGLFICSIGGFAFAKYNFRGKELLFAMVLLSTAVPQIVTIIPVYALLANIGWLNTFQALILPIAVSPFGLFFMRSYIQGIPTELVEAGRIDGCSEFQIYIQLILPVIRPALGALAIFIFLDAWLAYFWPLIMIRTADMQTMPLGLATIYADPWRRDYGMLMAGATLATTPILMIFLLMQRQFVEGLTRGMAK